MKAPLAVLLLLASARAWSATAEFGYSVPAAAFQAQRARQIRPAPGEPFAVEPGALGAPVASVPLAALLDNVRTTKATFSAGGATVHVFGGKSRNKKNWFLAFVVDGQEARFYNGKKLLHWTFIKRTVHLELNGRRFSTYVNGKATDKIHSEIIVEPEGGGARSLWTAETLADDAYAAGAPVTFKGREYRLLYSRDFDENDDGEFAGYAADRSITLMTRENGKLIGYHWFEREIPRDSILVSHPKAVGADESKDGGLTIGLRLSPAGALELYSN